MRFSEIEDSAGFQMLWKVRVYIHLQLTGHAVRSAEEAHGQIVRLACRRA
jgi:hypothetical protein